MASVALNAASVAVKSLRPRVTVFVQSSGVAKEALYGQCLVDMIEERCTTIHDETEIDINTGKL